MDDFNKFKSVVRQYAKVYSEFEAIQEKMEFIPDKGDQKTGLIGEAYIYEYLSRLGTKGLEFGTHSEKGWDIKSSKYKFQIKTVSDYSNSKKVSTIHEGWDFLYFVYLNKKFEPEQILKIQDPGNWNNNSITGLKFPKDKISIMLNGVSVNIVDETDKFFKVMNDAEK